MTKIVWDQTGQRLYETGVDRGVLYVPNGSGVYDSGVAWNGLTAVTEKPTGAEATALYADNIKYLSLISVEQFEATIEAYTFPEEFNAYNGLATPQAGVYIGQQNRKAFGFSYRSLIGDDIVGTDKGYKIHMVYNATAKPSEQAHTSVNDTPEAITFSFDVTTVPVPVTGMKPTAIVTVDSTKVPSANLASLETILYGTTGVSPKLPTPDEVIALFAGSVVLVTPTVPSFASPTITIPTLAGVKYTRDDTGATVTGTVTIAGASGSTLVIKAVALSGYEITPGVDDDWMYTKA